MGKTKAVPTKEINETEFRDLVSSSASKVKQFLVDNPQVVYKGAPLLLFIYLFYPILLTGWYWLPWIWAIYTIYRDMPSETISSVMRLKKFILDEKCFMNFTEQLKDKNI